MLGALLALASAAFFGLNNAALRRGVVKGSVLQAMAVTVPIGVPLCAIWAGFSGGFTAMSDWDLAPWVWMSIAGILHFAIGRYGNYMATKNLGSTLSTPIQQVSIIISLVLAFTFLDETINTVNLFGILLIVLGPMVLVQRRSAVGEAGRAKGFEPQYGPGIFWGCVCALGYGTSPLFVAMGIGDGDYRDGLAGVLVSYLAATVVVLVAIGFMGGTKTIGPLRRETTGWFLLSALFVTLSQMFRYVALAIAPIAVVVPIQRLSVVFRLLFNLALNRDHEVFDRWVVLTILLTVIGAIALAGDTRILLTAAGASGVEWLSDPLF